MGLGMFLPAFFDGMQEADTRLRSRRLENVKVWEEFRRANPHASLDDLRGMAEKLSDGQNYLRGGLPAEAMLGRIAEENQARLADEQLQRELAGYRADSEREQYIDTLLKDRLLSNDDTGVIAAEALKTLNPTLHGYWTEKYLPRLDRKRDDLARGEARAAVLDFQAMAPGARDMGAADAILGKLSPRAAAMARAGMQSWVQKNAQDWELREFDKRMRIQDMQERRAEQARANREREEMRKREAEDRTIQFALTSPAGKALFDPATAAVPVEQKAEGLRSLLDVLNARNGTKVTPEQLLSMTTLSGPMGVASNQQAWQADRAKSFDARFKQITKFGEDYLTKGFETMIAGATSDEAALSSAKILAGGYAQSHPHEAARLGPAIVSALRAGKKTPEAIDAHVRATVDGLMPTEQAYKMGLDEAMALPPVNANPELERQLTGLDDMAQRLTTIERLAQQPAGVALPMLQQAMPGFKPPQAGDAAGFVANLKALLRAEIEGERRKLASWREHQAGGRTQADPGALAKAEERINALQGRLDALTYSGAPDTPAAPAPVAVEDFGGGGAAPGRAALPAGVSPIQQAMTLARRRIEGERAMGNPQVVARILAEEAARVGIAPAALAQALGGR